MMPVTEDEIQVCMIEAHELLPLIWRGCLNTPRRIARALAARDAEIRRLRALVAAKGGHDVS